jgi:hypothetical protein
MAYGLLILSDGTVSGVGEIEDLDVLIDTIERALPDLRVQARRKFIEQVSQKLTAEELAALAGNDKK